MLPGIFDEPKLQDGLPSPTGVGRIGVADHHPDLPRCGVSIEAANEAVHPSKGRGRNRVVLAGSKAPREQVA